MDDTERNIEQTKPSLVNNADARKIVKRTTKLYKYKKRQDSWQPDSF